MNNQLAHLESYYLLHPFVLPTTQELQVKSCAFSPEGEVWNTLCERQMCLPAGTARCAMVFKHFLFEVAENKPVSTLYFKLCLNVPSRPTA